MRSHGIVSRFISGPWTAIPVLAVIAWVPFLLVGYVAYIILSWVVCLVAQVVA